jgi:hypothetical protein
MRSKLQTLSELPGIAFVFIGSFLGVFVGGPLLVLLQMFTGNAVVGSVFGLIQIPIGLAFIVSLPLTWIRVAQATGRAAERKQRDYRSFFWLSVFFPVITWFAIALLPAPAAADTMTPHLGGGTERQCPFCAEAVKRAAVVCRWCGRDLPAIA